MITGFFHRKTASQDRSLRSQLQVAGSLIVLIPLAVAVYVLSRAGVFPALVRNEAVLIILTLVIVQAGFVLLRKKTDEVSSAISHISRAIAVDAESIDLRTDTEELRRLGESVSSLLEKFRDANRRIDEKHDELILLKKALETTTTGVTITDLEQRICYVNPAEARMHGYQREDLIGKDSRVFAPQQAIRHNPSPDMRKIRSWRRESVNTRKDGSIFPVMLISDLITNDRGTQVGIVTTCDDMSEMKESLKAMRQSEERYRMLVDTVPDIVCRLNRQGSFEALNPSFERITGWRCEEIIGRHFSFLINADDLQKARGFFGTILARRLQPDPVELRLLTAHGTYVVAEFNAVPIIEDGLVTGIFGIARDIGEGRSMKEESLRNIAAIEASNDGIAILDETRRFVYLNHRYARMYGYQHPRELVGESWNALYSKQETTAYERRMEDGESDKTQWHVTSIGTRRDSTVFHQNLAFTGIPGNWLVCVVRDITDMKAHEESLRYLEHFDAVTGLPNRLLFSELLNRAIAAARENGHKAVVMLLDLDRFKTINDTLGHSIGDMLIHAVGQRLKTALSDRAVVTRLGGDEFLILIPVTRTRDEASSIAALIISKMTRPFIINDHEIYVTPSIGFCVYPDDGEDVTTLIKNADSAMYRAKERGRNTYHAYEPSGNSAGIARMTMEGALRKALDRDEFILHYQPQFELRTGAVVGTEALIRWQHPDWGLLLPKEFIALSEETGLIVPIGEWLLETSCRQGSAWQTAGIKHVSMAVNLSLRQFRADNLLATILRALEKASFAPESLELELTESIIMHDPEATIGILKEIKRHGINLSIDDFGTGYSSLNYLKHLPLSKLKIAQHFIDGIAKSKNDEAIISTIIQLAHSLDLRVIAEGVETAEQLDYLKTINCDEIQGFLFSRPLPPDELSRLLSSGFPPPSSLPASS